MWLVGCIKRINREEREVLKERGKNLSGLCVPGDSKNYEFSPPPSQPWLDPDATGHYPALSDGHPRVGFNLLSEFLFLGRIGDRAGIGHDRVCNVVEGEEGITIAMP